MNEITTLYENKPSVVMQTLEKLGWVKFFNPAIKGQVSFLPRGTVVFNLMSDFLKSWVKTKLSSLEIRTPILYDFLNPRIYSESSQFKDRSFQTEVYEKTAVLRPGGDYGVMSLLSSKIIHESHLPISLFELALSFRKNQSRELAGILRANVFTLLDQHTFAANIEQAWEVYASALASQVKLGELFNFDIEVSFDIESTFYQQNKSSIKKLEQLINKEVVINEIKEISNYWIAQHYLIDKRDNIGFCDGQYDLFNAKNYNISFTSLDGKTTLYPIICHASFGSIERWIFKLVNTSISSNGYTFPIWLSPVQIRLLCAKPIQTSYLEKIITHAFKNGIRLEIDNRDKSLRDKINAAQAEWVPFIVILSENFYDLESNVTVIYLNNQQEERSLLSIFEKVENSRVNDYLLPDLQSVISRPCLR